MATIVSKTRVPQELRSEGPEAQITWLLSSSKKAGLPFDRAWEAAWEHVVWPHDTAHRREWKIVLEESRVNLWQAAYEGRVPERRMSRRSVAAAIPIIESVTGYTVLR